MKLSVILALLPVAAALQHGLLVPPHNWQYTVGDRTCTKNHCSVRYPVDDSSCTCGGHAEAPRQIMSCLPHCGATCGMCEQVYPATKHVECPASACAPGEWATINVDCKVSEWPEEWSKCSKPCKDKDGPGVQFKRKRILVPRRNNGAACPSSEELYKEQVCNEDICTDPLSCVENPYCAGAMEECPNVKCDVKQHEIDGGRNPTLANNCVDDGYGVVTCDEPDFFKDGDTGDWRIAHGKSHIRVSHKSWSPRTTLEMGRQNDGDQHFCRIHYPFGLEKPYCKCLCARHEHVVKQCNFDRTECHLVATKGLAEAIAANQVAAEANHFQGGTSVEHEFRSDGRPETRKENYAGTDNDITIRPFKFDTRPSNQKNWNLGEGAARDPSRGLVLIKKEDRPSWLSDPCGDGSSAEALRCRRATATVMCRENGYLWGRAMAVSDRPALPAHLAAKRVNERRSCTGTELAFKGCPGSPSAASSVPFAVECFNINVDVGDWISKGIYERCNKDSWEAEGASRFLSDIEQRISSSLVPEDQVVGKCPNFPLNDGEYSIIKSGKRLMREGYVHKNNGGVDAAVNKPATTFDANKLATEVCKTRGFYAGTAVDGDGTEPGVLAVSCVEASSVPAVNGERTASQWNAFWSTGSWSGAASLQ